MDLFRRFLADQRYGPVEDLQELPQVLWIGQGGEFEGGAAGEAVLGEEGLRPDFIGVNFRFTPWLWDFSPSG